MDGDTSGLRYAAPAPGSAYPNASSPLQGGGDQVAKSDPNWGDYTQLAAGPGYSGLGQSSLAHQLDVLAHGSLDEIRALNAALGIQNSSARMGAGAEITINITDGSPTLPNEALQPQPLDQSVVAAAVAATQLPAIDLTGASPAPEQQRQTQADAAVAAGTYNTFSAMGHALASGNLGDFWYHFAQYQPQSDAAKAALQAVNDRVKGPPPTPEQQQLDAMLGSPIGAGLWGLSTQAGADPRLSNALLAAAAGAGQFAGGMVGIRQPGQVVNSQGPLASRPRGVGNTGGSPAFVPYRNGTGELNFSVETGQLGSTDASNFRIASDQFVLPNGRVIIPSRTDPNGASQFIHGTFDASTGELSIGKVYTANRGLGIGTELTSRAVEQFGAENVTSISGELGADNLRIYNQALSQGATPMEAAMQTPAAAIRARLGYGNITFDPVTGVITGTRP